jgi:hypothetical protein
LGTDLGGRYGEWIDLEIVGVKDGVEIRARARMERGSVVRLEGWI